MFGVIRSYKNFKVFLVKGRMFFSNSNVRNYTTIGS